MLINKNIKRNNDTVQSNGVSHLSFFAIKGNVYETIGEENGNCFEITNGYNEERFFVFKVFDSDPCQYVGFYTGKILKNLSFIPGCDVIIIGNFEISSGKTSINSLKTIIYNSIRLGYKEFKYGDSCKDSAINSIRPIINLLDANIGSNLIDIISEWNFFIDEQDEYLITLSYNDATNEQVRMSLLDNDPRIKGNTLLMSMLNAFIHNKSGAALILYPRKYEIDEIVGCALVHPYIADLSKHVGPTRIDILVSLWVCDELRLKGYGRKLLKKAASICNHSLFTFLPHDDTDETYDLLKFFKSCGCKISLSDSGAFGNAVKNSICYDKIHRIVILDDLS